MGQISFDNPIPGQPDSTEEPKIVTALTTIRGAINGGLDTNNLAPTAGILDTQFGGLPLSNAWRMVAAASRIIVTSDGSGPLIAPFVGSQPQLFTLSAINGSAPQGRSAVYRIHAVGGTGTTPVPAANTLTAGLYAATVRLDGQGAQINTSATTATQALPNTLFNAFGSQTALADNFYCLGVSLASPLSAGALYVCVYLEARYV